MPHIVWSWTNEGENFYNLVHNTIRRSYGDGLIFVAQICNKDYMVEVGISRSMVYWEMRAKESIQGAESIQGVESLGASLQTLLITLYSLFSH